MCDWSWLFTDWFHKLKVTGLNNSETTTDSLSIINSKNIPKHTTYLILILVFEKYYFAQVFNRVVYRIPTPNRILLRILPLSDLDITPT